MATDKVKRAFVWMRNAMRIIDKTTLPGEIAGEIRPTVDTFGWDRLNPQSSGAGLGPQTEAAQGPLAGDSVLLTAVPQGVMRYVIYASMSHDDPLTLVLSMQIRISGLDIGVFQEAAPASVSPFRIGLNRPILLAPGEQLLCRSSPAPAAGQRLFVRYKFVDLDPGEYIPAL